MLHTGSTPLRCTCGVYTVLSTAPNLAAPSVPTISAPTSVAATTNPTISAPTSVAATTKHLHVYPRRW